MAITQEEIDEIVVRVTADVNSYVRSLGKAERETRVWTTTLGTLLGNFALQTFNKLSAGVKGFIQSSIRAASDAQEALSAFQQVFGDEASLAAAQAEQLARSVGRSSVEIKAALTSQQAFFVGMGFGKGQARDLSLQMQRLAIDLASFRNLSDEDTINRFRSALSGSSEVLDQFGINIKISALAQEALAQGISKSVSKMTEQEKVMLRIAIIAKSLGAQGAIGDAERTMGQFANQNRAFNATLAEMKVAIGDLFLPVFQLIIIKAGQASQAVTGFIEDVKVLLGLLEESPEVQRSATRRFAQIMEDVTATNTHERIMQLQEQLREARANANVIVPQGREMARVIPLLEQELDKLLLIANQERINAHLAEKRAEKEMVRVRLGISLLEDMRQASSKLGDVLRPLFGRGTLSGDLGIFGTIGARLNQFQELSESLKQTQTVRQTGGRAVFAGTSEAVSLTQISQRTVSENDRRDKLLKGANDFLRQLVDNGKQVLSTLKDNGITVEGVDIP